MSLVIAIVGSRERTDEHTYNLVDARLAAFRAQYPHEPILFVSGGARGPDTFGEDRALIYAMQKKICRPQTSGLPYHKRVEEILARNTEIVEHVARGLPGSILVAFIHPGLWNLNLKDVLDCKGGTQDTLRKAIKAGLHIEIYHDALWKVIPAPPLQLDITLDNI